MGTVRPLRVSQALTGTGDRRAEDTRKEKREEREDEEGV